MAPELAAKAAQRLAESDAARARAREAFGRYDVDGSGTISHAELSELLRGALGSMAAELTDGEWDALVADAMYGIALVDFMDRVPDAVDASSFWVGVLKAPVFALAIALVSCYQGLCVQGSAASVGVRTTQSVVLGIFLVIVLDAAFSIVFQRIGL